MGSGSLGERKGGKKPILVGCRGTLYNPTPTRCDVVCVPESHALSPSSLSRPQEYVAYSHTGRIIPAIWFRYDLSPITVKYTERRQPLYRFITTVSGWRACWGLLLLVPPRVLEERGHSLQGQGLRLYTLGSNPEDVQKCHQSHINIGDVSSGKYVPAGNATKSISFLKRVFIWLDQSFTFSPVFHFYGKDA